MTWSTALVQIVPVLWIVAGLFLSLCTLGVLVLLLSLWLHWFGG